MPRAFLKFRFRGCFTACWLTGALAGALNGALTGTLTGARCQPLQCDLTMPSFNTLTGARLSALAM